MNFKQLQRPRLGKFGLEIVIDQDDKHLKTLFVLLGQMLLKGEEKSFHTIRNKSSGYNMKLSLYTDYENLYTWFCSRLEEILEEILEE